MIPAQSAELLFTENSKNFLSTFEIRQVGSNIEKRKNWLESFYSSFYSKKTFVRVYYKGTA